VSRVATAGTYRKPPHLAVRNHRIATVGGFPVPTGLPSRHPPLIRPSKGTLEMTNDEIQARLRQFILKQFPAARKREIGSDDSLLEAGIVDSLGVIEIVSMIEQDLGVTLEDDELMPEHFASIAAISKLIHSKMQVGNVAWTT
jgi:acyl carrier protein